MLIRESGTKTQDLILPFAHRDEGARSLTGILDILGQDQPGHQAECSSHLKQQVLWGGDCWQNMGGQTCAYSVVCLDLPNQPAELRCNAECSYVASVDLKRDNHVRPLQEISKDYWSMFEANIVQWTKTLRNFSPLNLLKLRALHQRECQMRPVGLVPQVSVIYLFY